MRQVHVIGGGTFNHVRTHLALAAPAFGLVARQLSAALLHEVVRFPQNPFVRTVSAFTVT